MLISVGYIVIGDPSVCRDEAVALDGAVEIASVCEPFELNSVPVVGVLLIIGVLVAPDLSEIGLGGLSFKRRIEDRQSDLESSQDALTVQQRELGHAVEQLSVAVSRSESSARAIVQSELAAALHQQVDTSSDSSAALESAISSVVSPVINLNLPLNASTSQSDQAREELPPAVERAIARESLLLTAAALARPITLGRLRVSPSRVFAFEEGGAWILVESNELLLKDA